jgi:hypothetical protein
MTPRSRVERLLRAARVLADPTTELGRRAREVLPPSTRLSPEGVALALAECLEIEPKEAELSALFGAVRPSARTLVLLPANVFLAAHRALALALASSETVLVRPSRREPRFVELLARAEPGLFEIVSDLEPQPGDALWAYGGEETLASVREHLPEGVELHAQGPGYGVAVIGRESVTKETAVALARDIVPFDQRGCLSPRIALVLGSADDGHRFAALVASALADLERSVPLGALDAEERADAARFRDIAAYAGVSFQAGSGTVAVFPRGQRVLAPNGRNLVVVTVDHPQTWLADSGAELTALGLSVPDDERRRLVESFPGARESALGAMQRPPLDGPADRRGS